MYRILASLALALFLSAPAWAEGKVEAHQGTVISVSGNQLHMLNRNGTESTVQLAPNAMVFCDGKVCQLGDLKPGTSVWVTTPSDDLKVAVNVQAQIGKLAQAGREAQHPGRQGRTAKRRRDLERGHQGGGRHRRLAERHPISRRRPRRYPAGAARPADSGFQGPSRSNALRIIGVVSGVAMDSEGFLSRETAERNSLTQLYC
jgi:hypothetical protein